MIQPIEVKLSNNAKIIAHRGLSGIAPENTLDAFLLAGKYGYYGVECDFHVSKDGKFVVFHDATLERMTKSTYFLKDLNYDEISKFKIVSGNGINLYKDVKIPLLSEYLDICIKYDMVPVIEIKAVNETADLDKFIHLLKTKELLTTSHIISFSLEYLIYLRDKYPHLNIFYLVDKITNETITVCNNYQFNIDANAKNLTKEIIRLCHENNIVLNTYTVDNPEIAKILSGYGIDYITSNILYAKRQSD